MMIQSFVSMRLASIMLYLVKCSRSYGETLEFFGSPALFGGMQNVDVSKGLSIEGKVVVAHIPGCCSWPTKACSPS